MAAAPTDASIAELFRLMRAESLVDAVANQAEAQMRQQMAQAQSTGQPVTDEQRRMMEIAPPRVARLMREELTWAKMEPIQMAIFRETFDQTEVDGLIAFYRTPAGQAYVAKMPLAMQKTMVATQAMLASFAPKLAAVIAQAQQEAKAAAGR